MWKVRVFTLYPEMFPGPLASGLYKKALEKKIWSLEMVNIRDYATDKHKTVDDTPFGGGSGMVMKADVLANSLDKNIKYVNLPIDKFAYNVREFLRSAKKGEISEPIKISNFYYIDRLDNKKTIKPTYENLKPQIKEILVNIYVKNLMNKTYEDEQ